MTYHPKLQVGSWYQLGISLLGFGGFFFRLLSIHCYNLPISNQPVADDTPHCGAQCPSCVLPAFLSGAPQMTHFITEGCPSTLGFFSPHPPPARPTRYRGVRAVRLPRPTTPPAAGVGSPHNSAGEGGAGAWSPGRRCSDVGRPGRHGG